MTLRRQLLVLHIAFVIFALATALITVYVVQVQVRNASARFERVVSDLHVAQQLELDLQTLDVHFHEIAQQSRPVDETFRRALRSVLTRLADLRQRLLAANSIENAEIGEQLDATVSDLRSSADRCIAALSAGDAVKAEREFKGEVEPVLTSGVRLLRDLQRSREAAQPASARDLADYDTAILIATVIVAVLGVLLVLIGIWLVRERLILPLRRLQQATAAYARGDLEHRVPAEHHDELGELGGAMNSMAAALVGSQRKYQNLFQNLRDTVIVCDVDATVIECHQGDSDLLGRTPSAIVGQSASELWPDWRFGALDWTELVARVINTGRLLRVSDVALPLADGRTFTADIVAYPAHEPATPRVAIALRDVSERARLEQAARRGEAMEAAVTLARGVAHDFKNMLQNAVGSLGAIETNTTDPAVLERTRPALAACEQAARLSKRLSRLAADDRGHPEVLDVSHVAGTILDSLDANLIAQIDIQRQLEARLYVVADRDQLTRVILNLVYNACEAMPTGGVLVVRTRRVETANPLTPQRVASFVELAVVDTGVGMGTEARQRAFEPLYSTKPRADDGPRGLGLAIVYAAVNQAGGFTQVESVPGRGTTFRVLIPAHVLARDAVPSPSASQRDLRHIQ